MSYVDGFVLPVPRGNIDTYKAMAEEAGALWMKHGALEYKECMTEDTNTHDMGLSFSKAFSAVKDDEVLFFSYITFESRAHRDEVNKNVMKDMDMKGFESKYSDVFDCNRMAYGGFETVVDL